MPCGQLLQLCPRLRRWLRKRKRSQSHHCEMVSIRLEDSRGSAAYVGLMETIFLPSLLFTHSLLMKRPVGWVYFLPLGAVSSIERSDILAEVLLNDRQIDISSIPID